MPLGRACGTRASARSVGPARPSSRPGCGRDFARSGRVSSGCALVGMLPRTAHTDRTSLVPERSREEPSRRL